MTDRPTETTIASTLAELRRGNRALALELPAVVHEDYSRLLDAFVDAVLAAPASAVVTLTRAEAEHAADWHDYVVDQGGDVPAEETELALRLRRAAAL